MNKVSIFLGAGFSKWASNLPVASQLFDYNIIVHGKKEALELEFLKQIKGDWDTRNPNEPTEKFIADALSLVSRQKQVVIWYIVRRLTDTFIHVDSNLYQYERYGNHKLRRHVLWIDEIAAYKHSGVRKARTFLKERGIRYSGVVTTNYDLLVEYSYNSTGFNYGERGEQLSGKALISLHPAVFSLSKWEHVHLNGDMPLAKLHGSISWDNENKYIDGRCGLTGKALLVAPQPEKVPPDELKVVWELSSRILEETTHLVVFGFAFNPYDKAVLDLLRNCGQNIREILLIDINPNIKAAKKIWKNAIVESAQPPPPGDIVIDNWMHNACNEKN
jgi:hypothetical protein